MYLWGTPNWTRVWAKAWSHLHHLALCSKNGQAGGGSQTCAGAGAFAIGDGCVMRAILAAVLSFGAWGLFRFGAADGVGGATLGTTTGATSGRATVASLGAAFVAVGVTFAIGFPIVATSKYGDLDGVELTCMHKVFLFTKNTYH